MLRIMAVGFMLAAVQAGAQDGMPASSEEVLSHPEDVLSPSAKDLAILQQAMTAAQRTALDRAAELSVADAEGRGDEAAVTSGDDGAVKETIKVRKRHGVTAANTLWEMAKYYYEDPFKWPLIYEANKHRIKDPHWIYPGQTFIIPGLDKMVTVVKELPRSEPAPQPAPAPEPEEEPVNYDADKSAEGIALPDDLSVELPAGMAGQQPAMYRMMMEDDWTPDGKVIEFRGREAMVAAGDAVAVSITAKHAVSKRQRYTVYRRAAASESDVNKRGKYYQKVGLIEIIKRLDSGKYQALILKSGGSVQLNDVLKLER
ncbi:MAG: hypothetical protein ABIJ96_11695 [Elusimicrobiota bacterium]